MTRKKLKHLLIWLFVIISFFFVSVYIFIPSTILIKTSAKINCNYNGATRTIKNWSTPFYKSSTSPLVNDYTYILAKPFSTGADIVAISRDDSFPTKLLLYPRTTDTLLITWNALVQTGNNPSSKIKAYLKAEKLKQNLNASINHLGSFLSNEFNLYKLKISYTTLTDTFLITTKHSFLNYPTARDISTIVTQIRYYIQQQNAQATNYPMLNVTKNGNIFLLMVGIPVNRPLQQFNDLFPKRLSPIKDKILTTTVVGGDASIQNAYKEIELYMQDHSLRAPVIPFEFMVTDRSKESDTSKWVTKIYYPII